MKKIYARSLSATSVGVLLVYLIYRITPHKTTTNALNKLKKTGPLDVIIVPGVPYEGKDWHPVMQARVMWSVILYQNGYTKNIIYSGGAVYSPYKEGIIMGLYAEKLGVPKEHIFYETAARHSTENVFFSYLQARKLGFKSIGLATDVFQSTMLKPFTKNKFSTPIHHLPFTQDAIAAYTNVHPEIDPTPAFTSNFVPISQDESFLKRLKGTLGGNMDFKQYSKGKLPPL